MVAYNEGYCFSGRRPSDIEQLRVITVKHVHVLLVSHIYLQTKICFKLVFLKIENLYVAIFKDRSQFMKGDVFDRKVHSGCLL